LLCCVVWYKFADVLEGHTDSISRVEEQAKQTNKQWLNLIFDPEDGCSKFLESVSKLIPDYMA
jgi:hypothetical protein